MRSFLSTLFFALFFCSISHAATFSPIKCNLYKNIHISYPMLPGRLIPFEIRNPNNYVNNINYQHYFVFNGWVSEIQLGYLNFRTEPQYDHFDLFGPSANYTHSGNLSNFWGTYNIMYSSNGMLPTRFIADWSVPGNGFEINESWLFCGQNSLYNNTNYSSMPPIPDTVGVTGALLGTNDVVYIRYNNDISSTYAQTFVLSRNWYNNNNSDFDIYVKCGRLPTPTDFDYRGYNSGMEEYVHIPPNYCNGQGNLYVAVNSWSGEGAFDLTHNYHNEISNHISLYVYADQYTSAEWPRVLKFLEGGAAYFYGASEGTVIIDNIYVTNKFGDCPVWGMGGSHCDIMIFHNPGRAHTNKSCYSFMPSTVTVFYSNHVLDNSEPSYGTFAHEEGHHLLSLSDEYVDIAGGSEAQCGHSVMGWEWGRYDFCLDMDHMRDKVPDAPTYNDPVSEWSHLKNDRICGQVIPGITNPSFTPDASVYDIAVDPSNNMRLFHHFSNFSNNYRINRIIQLSHP